MLNKIWFWFVLNLILWAALAFVVVGLLIPSLSDARTIAVDRSIAVDGGLVLTVRDPADTGPLQRSLVEDFASAGQGFQATAVLPAAPDSVRQVLIPFPLNIGAGARWFFLCVSENGFVWLLPVASAGACPAFLAFAAEIPARDFILADYSDLKYARIEDDELDGTTDIATGLASARTPYRLNAAAPALAVVWYEQPYVAGGETTQQILLIDRARGDFDLMLNQEGPPASAGWHGFSLGSNQLLVRHADASVPDRFCFRNGGAHACR